MADILDDEHGIAAGAWKVEPRRAISMEGVTVGFWMSDGTSEMVSFEQPVELMIALAKFCGVESWENVDDEEADEEADIADVVSRPGGVQEMLADRDDD